MSNSTSIVPPVPVLQRQSGTRNGVVVPHGFMTYRIDPHQIIQPNDPMNVINDPMNVNETPVIQDAGRNYRRKSHRKRKSHHKRKSKSHRKRR